MQRELKMPDFLQEDADVIHNRMLENAPPDINLVEGDFFWDATRPTAEEKAELTQIKLQNILKIAFPQSSYGIYLEYLGEMKGVFRRPATKSTGVITIQGKEGTIIKKGYIASTISTDDKPSIEFEIEENAEIGSDGIVRLKATCIQPGIIGNVAKDTIKILSKSDGIESITNENEFANGSEVEDQEIFRERVLEAYQNEPLSGAKRDYERWAKEVPGVGSVYVKPEWDGPGTVGILILDSNGNLASEELLKAVRLHIMDREDDGKNTTEGLSPIGSFVNVTTPDTKTINISANFTFDPSFDSLDVINNIKAFVSEYLQTIDMDGFVMYKAIDGLLGSMIIRKEGIVDYNNLIVNGDTENIQLSDQVAIIGEVIAV